MKALSKSMLVVAMCFLASVAGASTLAERIDAVVDADLATSRTFTAVVVADTATSEILADRLGGHLFTPASNQKLYTSACALETWGPEKRFVTSLAGIFPRGKKSIAPVLKGDLVLVGGGDPVFTADDLRVIGELLRSIGVRKVDGNLYVDNSRFEPTLKGPGWMWDDDPEPYSMNVTAMMMDYNVLSAQIVNDESQPGVRLDLATDYPLVTSDTMRFEACELTRLPFHHEVILRPTGTGAPFEASTVRLTMEDPGRWIGEVFRRMLRENQIEIAGEVLALPRGGTAEPRGAEAILRHEGRGLAEILALFNKPSENAIGEMLFLNLARESTKKPGSWRDGKAFVESWLVDEVGLARDSFVVADGSGLSRYNQITAENTVRLLLHMSASKHRDVFVASLPVAGVDGSLEKRMTGDSVRGRVFAKTGTMTGVSCLSGYAKTKSGRTLAFSILMNGTGATTEGARALQDKLCAMLVEE